MDSLIKTYENRFRESWDEPALTDYGSDLTIRYCDVAKRISYLHLLFEQVGIRPGDKVALCDRNSANWAISMLAILTYRAVAVPLLTDYSNSQLVMLCEHCGARFMVGNKKLSQLWPEGKCPSAKVLPALHLRAAHGRIREDPQEEHPPLPVQIRV